MYLEMNFWRNDVKITEIVYRSAIFNSLDMVQIERITKCTGFCQILTGSGRR